MGSVIKGGAATKLPTQVGSWVTTKDASGPATIYKRDDALLSVGFLSGSDYSAIVTYIKHMKTRAGTGYCGSTEIKTSLTCYLETVDGVINISADSTEVPLTDLVTFTNQLTAVLGTK